MTISRYDIPLDGREHVLTNAIDGRPVEGRPVAVAAYPNPGGHTIAIWVMAECWPRHEIVVRVARDDEPINLAGDWWDHAGTSAADGDEGTEALHVLYHRRRRRTETEASDA